MKRGITVRPAVGKTRREDGTGLPASARFAAALEELVIVIKEDRSILAAILCGSLSHDVVWEKSDIDVLLVTIDDRNVASSSVTLSAQGVHVHALLVPRNEFRKMVEGSTHHSFTHSYLAKGRVLYSHDDTITALCARLTDVGAYDTSVQLLRAATQALPPLDKAHKWFETRGDLDYAALWLLYAATPLAQIEVLSRRLLLDREVLPQAVGLNPAVFQILYTDVLNQPKTRARIQAALGAADRYIAERAHHLFAPILTHLADVGEVRSATDVEDHFKKHMNTPGITTACEYLADRGLIGQVASPMRLTKRSNVDVQELAFVALSSRADLRR